MGEYVVVTGDFVCTGGMDRANFALADYLLRQGHRVHLVAHRVAESLMAYDHVVVHRVPKLLQSYLLASPLLDRVGRNVALQVAARGGKVLVNGANCFVPGASHTLNWVHYVHHAYAPEESRGWRRWKAELFHRLNCRAERRVFGQPGMLVANSWRTRQDLVHHFGRSPETIAVVYLGIDGTQFGPLAPEQRLQRRQGLGWHNPTLLFIGNPADPRKGFATVLSAWAEVCGDPDWDAHLVVVGGGAALKGDRLRGLGFRDDVPHLLPAADGLVSPTRYESYGMGVHEAICCGVPAIVSRDAGVAERYPEGLQDLLLRDPRSGAELATVLRQWRRHLPEYPNRVADFGEQLRQRSWDRMAAEIVSLWF